MRDGRRKGGGREEGREGEEERRKGDSGERGKEGGLEEHASMFSFMISVTFLQSVYIYM